MRQGGTLEDVVSPSRHFPCRGEHREFERFATYEIRQWAGIRWTNRPEVSGDSERRLGTHQIVRIESIVEVK
jgi:hypothetical protein